LIQSFFFAQNFEHKKSRTIVLLGNYTLNRNVLLLLTKFHQISFYKFFYFSI